MFIQIINLIVVVWSLRLR